MKKRILAILLAVLLAIPSFAVTPGAAEKTAIGFASPAIPAEEGKSIDLTVYSVELEPGAEAAEVTAWEYEGKEITSFTPEKAGVYTLTAKCGEAEKTVYVVAKKPEDKEYVIYYNGFDTEDDLKGLTKDRSAPNRIKVENAELLIDATGYDMVRVTLPEWLGDFGDYSITAKVRMTDELNDTRWNSICYRANGASYPFYHMCVRKTCGKGSGVEFALRTPKNAWDVQDSGTHKVNQTGEKYYEYNVQAKGDVIIHSIDGNRIIYNDMQKEYKTGCIGLISNYSVMHVDYIRVALQLSVPEIEVPETLIRPSAQVDNITNALANVAELRDAASVSALGDAHCVILKTDGTDVFAADGSKVCALPEVFDTIGNTVIPVFGCETKAAVDGVISAVKKQRIADATVLSADASILAYARGKQPLLRGVIDLRGKYDHVLTYEETVEARALINGSDVKTGLFDAACLDRAAAEELRSMLLTVWAYTDSGSKQDLLHALLIGAHGVVTPSPEKVKEAYSLFESGALTRTPVIIGHRGNPTNAPENSISSYRMGYINGADVVETDVYITKDGEVVVMHDNDITRTTTGSGNIESMTLEQLKQYNLWAGSDKFKSQYPDERIPTLREIFELMQECEGLKLFIEIKTSKPEVCNKIVDLANEYGMMARISVISFNLNQLINMHKVAPEISCGYLLGAPTASSTDGLAAQVLSGLVSNVVGKNTTYNPSYTTLTYKLLNAANARGITIWPWTYTESLGNRFAYAFKAGFGGLTTNDAQYTKNNIKYITAPASVKAICGESRNINVTSVTYGKKTADISDKIKITVISGEDVVSADGSVLTALKEGTAYVMCSRTTALSVGAKEGGYTVYTDVIRVDVLPASEGGSAVLDEGSAFTAADGVIRAAAGSTVSDLKAAVINAGATVFGGDAEKENASLLATGDTLKNAAGAVLGAVAVAGDLNGDSVYDEKDAAAMAGVLVEKPGTTQAQFAAGDINGDGFTNVTDYIVMKLNYPGDGN